MPEERVQRRLAAILAADVVGYSRLMQADEAGTLTALKARRTEIFQPLIATHHGRIVKVMGDGVLVEFASAVNATICAVALQEAMEAANAGLPDDRRIVLRIGINLGDVMVEGQDLYGDGVNIAARLEALADAGSVFVSQAVFSHVKGKTKLDFEDRGEKNLKNMAEPVRAYRVSSVGRPSTDVVQASKPSIAVLPFTNMSGDPDQQYLSDGISGKLDFAFDDLGEQSLKNIAVPVQVYRVSVTAPGNSAAAPPRTAASEKPSIAVLPFTNMSGDPEQAYFSDGITEDIITELSRFRSLFVVARNSSFQYQGKHVDIKRIGRELGVRFAIEGSVRKLGGRMRVTAQLIDAGTGNHIWAERFDRDLRDIFGLQDDLVHAVVATVSGRIDAASRHRAVGLSPARLEAYDLHLRAKALYLRFTRVDNAQARAVGQRAIEIDPENALAAAYYALYCVTDYMFDWAADLDHSLATAMAFAERAVGLDDTDATARWILAIVHMMTFGFAGARIHLAKALELNPSDTEARGIYAWFLSLTGEPDQALEQFEIVRRHNPFDVTWLGWIKGQAYFVARRYEEAIATFSQAHGSNNEINAWLAASNAMAGREAEAQAKLQEFLGIAEKEMVHFPGRQPDAWMAFLRRSFIYEHGADLEHLCDGLRKAGLPI